MISTESLLAFLAVFNAMLLALNTAITVNNNWLGRQVKERQKRLLDEVLSVAEDAHVAANKTEDG